MGPCSSGRTARTTRCYRDSACVIRRSCEATDHPSGNRSRVAKRHFDRRAPSGVLRLAATQSGFLDANHWTGAEHPRMRYRRWYHRLYTHSSCRNQTLKYNVASNRADVGSVCHRSRNRFEPIRRRIAASHLRPASCCGRRAFDVGWRQFGPCFSPIARATTACNVSRPRSLATQAMGCS